MRLNEKHLTALVNGTAPVDKEGMLYKRGEVNKSFQKRWFVLKGNILYYFDKKGDREPIGLVILEGCTVELSESSDAFSFELVFHGFGTRTYVLAADTQEEMEDWMKAIACAGYDYMKLMVAELQRQLDDLNTNKFPIVSPATSSSATASSRDAVLIDFDLPSTSGPPLMPQPPLRRNPFNAGLDDNEGSKTIRTPGRNSMSVGQARTFTDMHRDFGSYINKKLAETHAIKILME